MVVMVMVVMVVMVIDGPRHPSPAVPIITTRLIIAAIVALMMMVVVVMIAISIIAIPPILDRLDLRGVIGFETPLCARNRLEQIGIACGSRDRIGHCRRRKGNPGDQCRGCRSRHQGRFTLHHYSPSRSGAAIETIVMPDDRMRVGSRGCADTEHGMQAVFIDDSGKAEAANVGDVHGSQLGRQNRPFVHTADYGTSWAVFGLTGFECGTSEMVIQLKLMSSCLNTLVSGRRDWNVITSSLSNPPGSTTN